MQVGAAAMSRHERPRAQHERSCVGCRTRDDSEAMVRLVIDPESPAVAVDFKGGNFGRGVWVHAQARCVTAGAKALGKTLGTPIEAASLYALLVAAADRRASALVVAARRAGKLAVGSTAVGVAVSNGTAQLLIVATDARAAATTPWVERSVAAGRVVAWSTKDELGAVLGRQEAGVIAVLDKGLADALRRALQVVHMAPPDPHGGAISDIRRGAGARTEGG